MEKERKIGRASSSMAIKSSSTDSTNEIRPGSASRLVNFMGSLSKGKSIGMSSGKSIDSSNTGSRELSHQSSSTTSSNNNHNKFGERSIGERIQYRKLTEEITLTLPPPSLSIPTPSSSLPFRSTNINISPTPRLPHITPTTPISTISFENVLPVTPSYHPPPPPLPPSTPPVQFPKLPTRSISNSPAQHQSMKSQSYPPNSSNTVPSSSTTRKIPILAHESVIKSPPTSMYWSKTPISGRINKGMRAHSCTTIEGQNNLWLFGGCDSKGNCFRDVWKLDGDTFIWSKPRCIGTLPPVTRAHTTTAVKDLLFIIGGGDGPTYFNETYYLDTLCLTWTKPIILGTPPSPRRAHTSILYKNKIIIFGGGNGSTALNDLFSLDVSNLSSVKWEEIVVRSVEKPIARGYHSMNLVGNQLIVFGGSDGTECFSDVWLFNLDTLIWNQINLGIDASYLFPRLSHTSTRIGSYLFIIGGHDGINFSNDLILFNLVTLQWESRQIYGIPPSPRGYHTTIIHDSRLFLIGGFNGKDVFDEVFTLDLGSSAFLEQITNFEVQVDQD